ncbi:MAG: putative transposase [Pseudoalteromonas tetraodonis]
MRYHVLFVIQLSTRKVHIAGIVPEPDGVWMKQVGRNLTDCVDGYLCG